MTSLPLKIEDWPPIWRELYEERASIIQEGCHFWRGVAEKMAEADTRKQFELSVREGS